MSLENFVLMGRTLFHDRQNPNSIMGKTLLPYWMMEACLNCLIGSFTKRELN